MNNSETSQKFQQFPNDPERQKFWDEFTRLSKHGDVYCLSPEVLKALNIQVKDPTEVPD